MTTTPSPAETVFFSQGKLLEGSFIAYICGVEVPIQRVQVHMTVGGQEPNAVVELLPDPLISRLGAEDRLEVVVFYLDPFFAESQKPNSPSDFRLLFEGEILGWSYTNSPQGRRLSLTCGNFLKILSDLQPVYLSGPDSHAMNISEPNVGSNMALTNDSLTFPWSIFFYGFDQTQTAAPTTAPTDGSGSKVPVGSQLIRRPYDLIINVLNAVTGEFANEKLGSVISPNFFARYMKRVAFTQRFIPSPIIETDPLLVKDGVFPLLRALRDDTVLSALARDVVELGQNAPIWAAVQQMFLRMYYETIAITTAPIAQVNREPGSDQNGVVIGPPTNKSTATKPNCILNYITKPQWLFGIAPTCNVIFPTMVQEIHFEESYVSQPTRLYLNDFTMTEIFNASEGVVASMAAMRSGYPKQVQNELNKRYGIGVNGANYNMDVSGKNFLLWPEEFFRGPRSAQVRMSRWFMMLTQYTQMQKPVSTEKQDASTTQTAKSGEVRSQAAFREVYARYEYYRQRAENRAGTVITIFNPYVIPGYPIVVFDDLTSGQHFTALATDVRHELSTDGWHTVVNYIGGQTLDEFFNELFDARVGNSEYGPLPELGAAPPYPIDEIRAVLQELVKAEEYFSALFHQQQTYVGVKKCAFDLTKAIEFILPSGQAVTFDSIMTSEDVQLTLARRLDAANTTQVAIDKQVQDYEAQLRAKVGPSPTALQAANLASQVLDYQQLLMDTSAARQQVYAQMTPGEPITSDILKKYVAIQPNTAFLPMFRDYYNAMRFAARPICTLEEYIDFRGKHGVRERRIEATDPAQGKGGVYYEKILNFKAGPGTPPAFDVNNCLTSPPIADLPDTRIDWESRLKAYRAKVILRKTNQRYEPKGSGQ